jgi:cytochrome P450
VSLERKTNKNFVFSDGTFLPPNTFVSAAAGVTHMDEANYPNAHEFDGFRFYNLRKESNEENKFQLVSLDLGFMGFGNGRGAW